MRIHNDGLEAKVHAEEERARTRIITNVDPRHPVGRAIADFGIHAVVFGESREVLDLEIDAAVAQPALIDERGEVVADCQVG